MHTETPSEIAVKDLMARVKANGHAVESKTEREKREAEEASEFTKLQQLGRIEEIRAELARGYENYAHSVDQAMVRLNGMVGGSVDRDVQKAARAVADAYDISLNLGGLKQPKAPKGPSPFAEH